MPSRNLPSSTLLCLTVSLVAFLALSAALSAADPALEKLAIEPIQFTLNGQNASQQLLVTGTFEGRETDLTREIVYQSKTPNIIHVNKHGVVTPVGDGQGVIEATFAGQTVLAKVVVTQSKINLPVSFQLHIQPILTARNCNMGACHGKARGQNGFKLSLLGFDSNYDYDALTKHARGRRVFPADPERSLLLRKGSGLTAHGGGQRLEHKNADYNTLLRWITFGAPRKIEGEPTLTRVEVSPTARLMKPSEDQQLLVTAFYSDSTHHDVTGQTAFQSNESAIVAVDSAGLVKAGPIPGEATIMARYMGLIATCSIAIPLPGEVPDSLYENLPRNNFIDDLVWQKLQSLGITPSEQVDDAKYMRRIYIDLIGRFPTPEETRGFLADPSADKRARLVEAMLERPEFANHWANKWVDLLRPNPYRVGIKAVLNYDNWIRDSFRKNKPYDQFVRELVSARGSTYRNGAVTLFRDRRSPDELTTLVSQLFLGIRLECAKCHHHPFERWTQEDFYSFASFFSRIGHKGTGLSPPISGSEEMIFTAKSGSVKHPLTGKVLLPKVLFGDTPEIAAETDPRQALATWITSDENEFFAQVLVNRVWADLMGRGLVEPVDDLRATNPPTNGPLLEALANHFVENKYDLKQLLRVITSSNVYALSSLPSDRNVTDTRNYSRHYRSRLRAEVLLDAICDITDQPETFSAMPPKSRANEIWTHRVSSIFLDTFGRPDANQDPPCERTGEATVTQTLHLMNSPALYKKAISETGRAAQLAKSEKTTDEIVEELYLLVYSRFPVDEERRIGRSLFEEKESTRRQAAEDLLWALINTPEFIFKD